MPLGTWLTQMTAPLTPSLLPQVVCSWSAMVSAEALVNLKAKAIHASLASQTPMLDFSWRAAC
jgi:hypothetical protein